MLSITLAPTLVLMSAVELVVPLPVLRQLMATPALWIEQARTTETIRAYSSVADRSERKRCGVL